MAMNCRKPFIAGGAAFDCGQCLPCRIKRRRLWTHRIMLESMLHTQNTFVTLTYTNDSLVSTGLLSEKTGMYTLEPKHLQNWLKKLRFHVAPLKIRFFAVGEYGDKSERPHYHLILFGYPNCKHYRTKRDNHNRVDWKNCCNRCRIIGETWGFGDIELGECNPKSAGYIAGYAVKKMTAPDDNRLNGRHPEFTRMSLRPGLGADAIWDLSSALLSEPGYRVDVPLTLQHGVKHMPLGRYLRGMLREKIGREKLAPPEAMEAIKEELRALRAIAWNTQTPLAEVISRATEQNELNQVAKAKIFAKRVI